MPPIPVPRYQRRYGETNLPTVRQSADYSPDEFGAAGARVGNQVAAQLDRMQDQERQKQRASSLMDASSRLSDTELALRHSVSQIRGRDAIGAVQTDSDGNPIKGHDQIETALRNYDSNMSAIRDGLTDDVSKAQYDAFAQQQRRRWQDYVASHVQRQSDIVSRDSLQSAIGSASNAAAAAARIGDIEDAKERVGIAREAARAYAETQGIEPGPLVLKASTGAHTAAIEAFIGNDQPGMARIYFDDVRGEIEPGHAATVDRMITKQVAVATGRDAALSAVSAASSAATRPWDGVEVVQVDTAAVQASIADIEADSNLSPEQKASYRENAEQEMRTRQAQYRASIGQVWDRAITKLESSGMRLSVLTAEKDFLLDANAGETWGRIKAYAQGRVQQSRGAGANARQRAGMVDFLITLPERQEQYLGDEYDTGEFMREWGGRLHPTDLEQAASYIGKAGVAAGKGKINLPSNVVKAITVGGMTAGIWGALGPRSEDEQALQRLAYGRLLDLQTNKKASTGKPLTTDEVDDALKSLYRKWRVPGWRGKWLGTTRTAIELEESGDLPDPYMTVPEDHRAVIVNALEKSGLPTTDEWILYKWRAGQQMEPNPVPAQRTPELTPEPELTRPSGFNAARNF